MQPDVLVDDRRGFGVERELERHVVLHVVVWEREQVWGARPAGADEVDAQPDRGEVIDAYRRDGEDANGDGEVSGDARLDRLRRQPRASLGHHPGGECNDLGPQAALHDFADDGPVLLRHPL
jgi:hypothetical protein